MEMPRGDKYEREEREGEKRGERAASHAGRRGVPTLRVHVAQVHRGTFSVCVLECVPRVKSESEMRGQKVM